MGDFSRAQSSPGYFFTDSNGMPKTSSKSCAVNLSYDCSWALAQRPPPWRSGLLLMHAYPVTKTLRLSHTVKSIVRGYLSTRLTIYPKPHIQGATCSVRAINLRALHLDSHACKLEFLNYL
uniref:Uncharacterized protein n=1 Tax=Coccidioides posadasii RMSCC 3488 TaxID=454284 RepID=A0A0J6FJR8_COCPO|nr:hypothetical protein CPAG_05939 [Coccidioides posadasii RMSCC 3488]